MPATLLRLGGWRSVAALVLVAAAVTGIGQTGAGHSLLEKAGLIQQTTGYTALTFSTPGRPLSVTTVGRRASYKIGFRIQNAETRPHTYRWIVFFVPRPGRARLMKSRTVAVGPGKTASIPQTGKITCAPDHQVEFIVQLAGLRPAEAIHAWVSCPQPRS